MDEDGSLFNNILVLDMSHYSWLRDNTAWCQMISLWNMFVTTNDVQCQFMIHTILSAYISSIIIWEGIQKDWALGDKIL